jgi:pimeloyl-ACP methyl ester carboxylesterase
MLAGADLAADAARFPGPVLIAAGSADTITPAAGCEALARVFPRGEFRLLEGAGHLSYLDAAEAVNVLVAGFAGTLREEATQ